jgi:site-specific DNA-adenine methylase
MSVRNPAVDAAAPPVLRAVLWRWRSIFAKTPSQVEIINDTNGEVVNFYRIMQNYRIIGLILQKNMHCACKMCRLNAVMPHI